MILWGGGKSNFRGLGQENKAIFPNVTSSWGGDGPRTFPILRYGLRQEKQHETCQFSNLPKNNEIDHCLFLKINVFYNFIIDILFLYLI